MTTKIEKYDSGLSPERHNELANKFNPFMEGVKGLVATAKDVKVESVKDVAQMKVARETRLALKNIRVDVEKRRKELKEASLMEGKAIDGMANIIKFIIKPVEDQLQNQEDYVKKIEEHRIEQLIESRTAKLTSLGMDCSDFDLGKMKDEAFDSLFASAEVAHKAKAEAEERERARIEAERIAKEKAEAERIEAERKERERIEAENAKLRKEAEAAEKKAKAEKDKLRKEAEAKAKAAAEAAEIERKKQEDARKKAEAEAEKLRQAEEARKKAETEAIKKKQADEQAALAAPDAEKITALVDDICKLNIPAVSSEVALKAVHEVRGTLNEAVKGLRLAVSELGKKK